MKSLLLLLTATFIVPVFAETKLEVVKDQRMQIPAGPFYENSRPFYGRHLERAPLTDKIYFIHQGASPKPGYYSTLMSLDVKTQQLEKVTSLGYVSASTLESYERLDENEKIETIVRVHQFDVREKQLVYTALEFDKSNKLIEQFRPEYISLNDGDDPTSFRIVSQIKATRGEYMEDDYVPGFLVSFWNQNSKSRVVYYLDRREDYGTEMILRDVGGLQASDLVIGEVRVEDPNDSKRFFNYIVARNIEGKFQVYQLGELFPKDFQFTALSTYTWKPEEFFNTPVIREPGPDGRYPLNETKTFILPDFKKSDYRDEGTDLIVNSGNAIGGYVYVELHGNQFHVAQTDVNTRMQRADEKSGVLIVVNPTSGELCKTRTGEQPVCAQVGEQTENPETELINIISVGQNIYYAVKTEKNSNQTVGQSIKLVDAKTLTVKAEIETTGEPGVEVKAADSPGWNTGTWVIIKRSYEISAILFK